MNKIETKQLGTSVVNATAAPVVNASALTIAPRIGRENASRERKAQRLARAKELFTASAITFLGRLSIEQSQQVAEGKEVKTGIFELSQAKPDAAKCILCGGTHTLASAKTNSLISWYKKGTQVFALSDTCRQDYLAPYLGTALVNGSAYRTAYPKAPVKA